MQSKCRSARIALCGATLLTCPPHGARSGIHDLARKFRILGGEGGRVFGHHQKLSAANAQVIGKGKIDPAIERPASEINLLGPFVEELHPLRFVRR